ncbi:MAG: hypothetical protein EHM39_06410, partial [Chloroflexi bacterium]
MERRSSRQTGTTNTNPNQKHAQLTPQQMLILAIVTVLGGVALALAAILLVGSGSETSGAQALRTAAPVVAVDGGPAAKEPTPPALQQLAACVQINSGVQSATNARVIDGGVIEVLVDGTLLRIQFAGIRVPES